MKFCNKCKKVLPLEAFYKSNKNKDGLRAPCKKCMGETQKKYNLLNERRVKEKGRERWEKYYKANKRKKLDYYKKYRISNQEKINERWKRYYRTTLSKNIKIRISNAISSSIYQAIKKHKNNMRWELFVGYNLKELMRHLEKRFQSGMTWENYGEWELDHCVPKSAFNYNKPTDIDFKRCWALSNLQPLWKSENRLKRNKLKRDFQPSLVISA